MSNKKITFNDKIQYFEIKMDAEHVAGRNGLIWLQSALDRHRMEKEIKNVLKKKFQI